MVETKYDAKMMTNEKKRTGQRETRDSKVTDDATPVYIKGSIRILKLSLESMLIELVGRYGSLFGRLTA